MLLLQEYPAWWPNDCSTDDQSPCKDSQQKAVRQPPQVVYSAQNMQPSSVPLRSNDLITTQYMDVPSSGYAQSDALKGKLQRCGGSSVEPCCSTAAADPVQIEGNKENRAGAFSEHSLLDPALSNQNERNQPLNQEAIHTHLQHPCQRTGARIVIDVELTAERCV